MFYISYFFEFFAFAIGLYYFWKIRPVVYRYVILVLFITIVNEALAYFKVYDNAGVNKSYFYNSFFLIELIIFYLIFYFFYKQYNYKKYMHISSILFIISTGTAIFFLISKGVGKFNPFFLNTTCFCLICLGFLYYHFIYKANKVVILKKNSLFWFSTGLIIVNFIHLLFVNATFIESFRNNPNSKEIFSILNTIGNAFIIAVLL